jgi:hypothetical protein
MEGKVARKITVWNGKFVTMAWHTSLINSVLASQSIYHLIALLVTPDILHNIKKIEREFVWAGTDKVFGGQCKVNLVIVCRPKKLGGFGVLNTKIFSRALKLRCLWLPWKDPTKICVVLGNRSTNVDMDFFTPSKSPW